MGDRNRGESRPVYIRVYASEKPTEVSPRLPIRLLVEDVAVVEMRDGEILADAIDRGVVTIMNRLEVNHLYNVRSEPFMVADTVTECEKG